MLEVGETLTPRAMFGRGFNDIEIHMTLYDGVPVAAVCNVNTLSPNACRAEDLKSRFADWEVAVGSSKRGASRGHSDYHYFAIVYRPSVDVAEFRRIVIDDSGVREERRKNPGSPTQWSKDDQQELMSVDREIEAHKAQMLHLSEGSPEWELLWTECGELMKRRTELSQRKQCGGRQ